MGRYTDISRGPELQDAYEKYQLWLKKSRKEKVAAYKLVAKSPADRVVPERVEGYILPFESDVTNVYLAARILAATQTGQGASVCNTVRGLVADRVKEVAPTASTDSVIKIPRFDFARIIASQRTQTATTESDSRITDSPYKRHRSDNASSPFGRKTATDSYSEAVRDIKAAAAFKSFVATTGNRIGFRAEIG
jgi:hypothetical protein